MKAGHRAGGAEGKVGASCLEHKPWLNASAVLANTQGRWRAPETWQHLRRSGDRVG